MKVFKYDEITDAELNKMPHSMIVKAEESITVYEAGDELPVFGDPVQQAKSAALEALRQRKWQAKESGISVNGIKIDTDSKGQEAISGAVLNVLIDPTFKARWKTAALNPDGTAVWVELGKAEIMGIAGALTAHTEACFVVEEAKQQEISALKSATAISEWLEADLDKGWPRG